jgi:hypothetical protein
MGVLDASSSGSTLLDVKSWMPFATFTDSERMMEAALAAKTLVAEVRAPGRVFLARTLTSLFSRSCAQTRLAEATEATRLAADVRPWPA